MKLWISIALAIAITASHGAPTVQLVGIEGRSTEPSMLHVLGGQPVDLQLHIASATPGRVSVRASLYQLATGIAAPVLQDLPVNEGLAFDGSSIRPQKWTVMLPDVRAVTAMELRFAAKLDAEETWQPAGAARLAVYPADLLAQVKRQLSSAVNRTEASFVVLGESSQLKSLLRELGLAFEEVNEVSNTSSKTLYLAECSIDLARALIDQTSEVVRIVIFTRDSSLPAGVYWTERKDGLIAKITLPVLVDFASSPERQMLFLTVLQQALHTFQSSP